MKTILLTTAALLSLATAAQAQTFDSSYVMPNGERYSQSCYRGFMGYQCRSWWNGTGNSALVITVPEGVVANTNPNWGKGCRSCADVSK